jgi:hypothetical protein
VSLHSVADRLLVRGMRSSLQLEGGMGNIKVPSTACLEIVENLWGMSSLEAVLLNHDIG